MWERRREEKRKEEKSVKYEGMKDRRGKGWTHRHGF